MGFRTKLINSEDSKSSFSSLESVERQWRTTGSLGAKPYPPLEQSATALDQLRLVIQKLEIRDSIQLLNWKTLPEIQGSSAYLCVSIVYLCILYNDNYNIYYVILYTYVYIRLLNTSICKSYSQHCESANDQPQSMSAVSLSSVQDMDVGSAPVESTNTWAPRVSFQLLGHPSHHWNPCAGCVCVGGGYIERSLLMDWWPSTNMGIILPTFWPWHILIQLPSFHG